jgi:hypothetical protein
MKCHATFEPSTLRSGLAPKDLQRTIDFGS